MIIGIYKNVTSAIAAALVAGFKQLGHAASVRNPAYFDGRAEPFDGVIVDAAHKDVIAAYGEAEAQVIVIDIDDDPDKLEHYESGEIQAAWLSGEYVENQGDGSDEKSGDDLDKKDVGGAGDEKQGGDEQGGDTKDATDGNKDGQGQGDDKKDDAPTDYTKLTVPQLRDIAAQKGIEVKSNASKAEVLALVVGA